MTDALVSGLNFSRGKGDSEVAWVDALVTARDQICRDVVMGDESDESLTDKTEKILTLEPLSLHEVINFNVSFIYRSKYLNLPL